MTQEAALCLGTRRGLQHVRLNRAATNKLTKRAAELISPPPSPALGYSQLAATGFLNGHVIVWDVQKGSSSCGLGILNGHNGYQVCDRHLTLLGLD